ncbi:MAG: chorismate-binding protein [Pseudobdellovibrio sp.]
MTPVICFFENQQFIYADNYEILKCGTNENINSFLDSVESRFSDSMKIVQVNFEYENEFLFSSQKKLYDTAKAHVFILKKYELLSESELLNRLPQTAQEPHFTLLEEKKSFIKKVELIKKEISQGRIYQVNLTSALASSGVKESSLALFNHYYKYFQGGYKAYLPLEETSVLSYSPELFLNKKNNRLKTQPIKGSLAQNLNFSQDLLANEKEEAELSMIVDLLRNDLNRIETKTSAQVTKHRAAMELGYIQHTYSEITIETSQHLSSILKCTFPGGSISGCPKIESLKLLSEVETIKRQIYTGTIGWWKSNEFSLNLAIRTFIQNKTDLYYHAGCGIVYDSQPANEWEEFILKTGRINAR